jgi:hypothetical protein
MPHQTNSSYKNQGDNMIIKNVYKLLCSSVLALMFSHQALASTVDISEFDTWYQLDVDELIASDSGLNWIDAVVDSQHSYVGDGSQLHFSLTLDRTAKLTLVDAGLGGDRFNVFINGNEFHTSQVVQSNAYIGTDFESALLDPSSFSFLEIILDAGVYDISGSLLGSATDGGFPLNATVGALKVSEVPLPAAAWLFLSALGGLAFFRRRQ